MKQHKTSPLPFQGQKRNFIKHFKGALAQFPETATYVDLFGGSGLLSHIVKSELPKATVVYNDFDNFQQRLNAIEKTNKLLCKLRIILEGFPRGKVISEPLRQEVIEVITDADRQGFVDYITISSSILFSMNYVSSLEELKKETFYNKVRKSDYQAEGYLKGVEVVRYDYKELFTKYNNASNVVFLIDPPYLSTDVGTYTGKYWKLADYLDVLETIVNQNYFYFTSNKSQIIELCEWIGTRSINANPFYGASKVEVKTSTSHNSSYTDIMMFNYTSTVAK